MNRCCSLTTAKSIHVSRSLRSGKAASTQQSLLTLTALRCDADFVYTDLSDALFSSMSDLHKLHRLLQLAWVELWEFWAEVKEMLSACKSDGLKQQLVADYVIVYEPVYDNSLFSSMILVANIVERI